MAKTLLIVGKIQYSISLTLASRASPSWYLYLSGNFWNLNYAMIFKKKIIYFHKIRCDSKAVSPRVSKAENCNFCFFLLESRGVSGLLILTHFRWVGWWNEFPAGDPKYPYSNYAGFTNFLCEFGQLFHFLSIFYIWKRIRLKQISKQFSAITVLFICLQYWG